MWFGSQLPLPLTSTTCGKQKWEAPQIARSKCHQKTCSRSPNFGIATVRERVAQIGVEAGYRFTLRKGALHHCCRDGTGIAAAASMPRPCNPLTSLPEAVASAQRVLARQDGPTVLVGHSFSGMIVPEAGIHPNVSALVYVAARAPDAGEDYRALAKTFPMPPASAGIVFDGDEGRLNEAEFLRDFVGDLPEAKAKILYAVQEPFQKALLTGKTTHAAWRSKPSFYTVSTEDRTINPDLERFMAKRMGAKTIELKASHLSLISHPDEITRLILEAAGRPG
jgi:pimeloyl-ACP methyl ester carboxylesterase